MTNKKSTKRALLASVIALMLCVAMLAGTTYAWFTDSVTSANNIIKSGNLDVDLVDAAGNSMAGEVIEFVAADGRAQDEILWEPGCTYKTEPVKVVNKGNLALKYQIAITGIIGNAKLLEAIEWTVTVGDVETALADLNGTLEAGEESEEIVLIGHMMEEAGNEYMNLKVENIAITVSATQLASESDSEDNQYDAAAEYAAQTMLKNVAAVAAGETATVKLESDGYVIVNNASPVGATVVGDVTVDLNGKTLFVEAEDGNAHMSLFNIVKGGKLTVIGNGSIQMVTGENPLVSAIFNNTAGTLVIENGTYKMDNPANWQDALIPTIIDTNSSAGVATTTINGGDFYHTRNMFRNFTGVKSELTINGGTFNGKADDWAAIWNQKPSASVAEGAGIVTINGGTFNYVEISNDFDTGVTVNNGTVLPVLVDDTAALQDAIDNGESNIYLEAGEYTADLYVVPANRNLTITGAGPETKLSFADLQVRLPLFDSLTISNCTIERMPEKSWGHIVFGSSTAAGGVYTLKDCVFNGVGSQGIYINQDVAATFNIENCTFNGDFGGEGAITIQNNDGVNITVNVTDCEFNNIPATSHEIYMLYAYNGLTLNAEGVNVTWKVNP